MAAAAVVRFVVLALAVAGTARAGGLNVPITYTGCNAEPYGTEMTFEGQGPFRMLLDTGSSNLIVAADRCTGCDTSPNFSGAGYSGMQFINYGTGSITIVTEEGKVSVGGTSFDDVYFGPVVTSNDFFYTSGTCYNAYQGVMGLAYPALSHPPGQATVVDAIVQQQGTEDAFSTVLCPVHPSKISAGHPLGELIFGGASSKYGSDFQFTPVVEQMHYNVKVEGFSVNGKSIAGIPDLNTDSSTYSDNAAYLDTGTTTLNLNSECAAWKMFAAINKTLSPLPTHNGVWNNPCPGETGVLHPRCFWYAQCFIKGITWAPGTTFSVQLGGGASVEIDLANIFTEGPNNEGIGQTAVAMYDPPVYNQPWANTIIGQPVLMGHQVLFDRGNSRVGFAKLPSGVCPGDASQPFSSLIAEPADIDISPSSAKSINTMNNNDGGSSNSDGLSRNTVAGIVVGAVALVAVVGLVLGRASHMRSAASNAYEPLEDTADMEMPGAATQFEANEDDLTSGYVLYEDGQETSS